MGEHRRRVFLEIIRRQHSIVLRDERLKVTPGSSSRHP